MKRSSMVCPAVGGIEENVQTVVENGNPKKRKHSSSSKNQRVCTNKLATVQSSCESLRLKRTSSRNEAKAIIDIRTMTPTARGITEAARILSGRDLCTSGIVSVPTEKFYTFMTLIPFQKPIQTSNSIENSHQRDCRKINFLRSNRSGEVSVFIHHPVQAYNFVAFSTPKKFVFRQTSTNKLSSDESITIVNDSSSYVTEGITFTAVTFSESHEVLNRLSSAFWPGTVTIYAPVRTRRLKNDNDYELKGHASTESLTSLTSLTSEEGEYGEHSANHFPSIPVVPDTALRSAKDLFISSKDEKRLFVGMRCPSHPIARRILFETYGRDDSNMTQRLKNAVIGMNVSSLSDASVIKGKSYATTCKDVCKYLQSTDKNTAPAKLSKGSSGKRVLHVLNGEDQYVPTCQFGTLPSVSMVIDTPRRTVILLRDQSKLNRNTGKGSNTSNLQPLTVSNFDVVVEDVFRALVQDRSSDRDSIKSKTIAAVMSKWTVEQKEM